MADYENMDTMRAELAKLLAEKAAREQVEADRKAKGKAKQLASLATKAVKWQVSAAGNRIGAYGIPYLEDAQWRAVLREVNTESLVELLDSRSGGEPIEDDDGPEE